MTSTHNPQHIATPRVRSLDLPANVEPCLTLVSVNVNLAKLIESLTSDVSSEDHLFVTFQALWPANVPGDETIPLKVFHSFE